MGVPETFGDGRVRAIRSLLPGQKGTQMGDLEVCRRANLFRDRPRNNLITGSLLCAVSGWDVWVVGLCRDGGSGVRGEGEIN